MKNQFERWVKDPLAANNSAMAVFNVKASSVGYRRGQVRFLMDNPEVAEKLKITEDALNAAREAYTENDWDDVAAMPVALPE